MNIRIRTQYHPMIEDVLIGSHVSHSQLDHWLH